MVSLAWGVLLEADKPLQAASFFMDSFRPDPSKRVLMFLFSASFSTREVCRLPIFGDWLAEPDAEGAGASASALAPWLQG